VRQETAGDITYLTDGSGPLVVLLHGFPDTARTFLPLAPLLVAAGHKVALPWLRGYAPSTLAGRCHPDQAAADLLALGHALSPGEPFFAVGHDWGALTVLVAAAAAPDRLRAAVTLAIPHPTAIARNLRKNPRQLVRSSYMLLFQVPGVSDWLCRQPRFIERLWRTWSPGWTPPAAHLADVQRCLDESLPHPLAYYRGMRRRPIRVPTVRVPTLHLHGARDGCVGSSLGDGEERCFSGPFERQILPEVGHFLHLERPAAVAQRVLAWFHREA
jgi:pimeloyl-ACP methyl ester carboxylesterase